MDPLRGDADSSAEDAASTDRVSRLRRFLQEEVWPAIPPESRGKAISKEEEEETLGYGPDGV
jgi:antitoxin VapB